MIQIYIIEIDSSHLVLLAIACESFHREVMSEKESTEAYSARKSQILVVDDLDPIVIIGASRSSANEYRLEMLCFDSFLLPSHLIVRRVLQTDTVLWT